MSDNAAQRDRHIELMKAGLEAFNRGDETALMELLDPEMESYVAPGLVNIGTYAGHEGYRDMVGQWGEAWEKQVSTLVDVTAPDDNHVIAEIHQRATGSVSGVPVEMTVFYLLEVRDERAVRFHIYADRESAVDAIR